MVEFGQGSATQMGLTHITLEVANPARPRKTLPVKFLVDSGAVYSVVPTSTLRKLGVKAHSKQTFTLADGSQIIRRRGDLLFTMDGHRGAAPVIFGERGDSSLLGAVTLEALGVILDPIKRELRPLPMILACMTPHRPSPRHQAPTAALR
jgi:predicted aspartyl protease